MLVKYALRHIHLQPCTDIMSGSCVCLHKGRMALKGLLNSIVHSNSNKAALVHSWPLTRVYISIPYLSWWTRGQIWCIYIYTPGKRLALNADLDNKVSLIQSCAFDFLVAQASIKLEVSWGLRLEVMGSILAEKKSLFWLFHKFALIFFPIKIG